MRLTGIFITLFFCAIGCQSKRDKYADQFKVTAQLIQALTRNDTNAVFQIMGSKLENIGRDQEGLKFDINKACKIINVYGLPKENEYLLQEYAPKNANLLDIIIPFSDKGGHLKHPVIIVHFVKYLPANKIKDFRIKSDLQDP